LERIQSLEEENMQLVFENIHFKNRLMALAWTQQLSQLQLKLKANPDYDQQLNQSGKNLENEEQEDKKKRKLLQSGSEDSS